MARTPPSELPVFTRYYDLFVWSFHRSERHARDERGPQCPQLRGPLFPDKTDVSRWGYNARR